MKDTHHFFMSMAELCAEQSYCISLHVGAVLVFGERVIATGYNGTPRGELNCDQVFVGDGALLPREQHHEWSSQHEIHAEMNAILKCVSLSDGCVGCDLYVTHEPCDQCLKHIRQAGIMRVIYKHPYEHKDCCQSSYREECTKYMVHSISDDTYYYVLDFDPLMGSLSGLGAISMSEYQKLMAERNKEE